MKPREKSMRLIGLFLALLFVAFRAHSAVTLGEAMPMLRSSATNMPLLDASDTLSQVGDDGPPAWYWPLLGSNQVTYRVELDIPRRAVLNGLLVSAAGSTLAGIDTLRLTLRDSQGAVLLDNRVFLRGGGIRERLLFNQGLELPAGERLGISLSSSRPARPPWITADDDCRNAGRSWIEAPTLTPPVMQLDRDLNIRALVDWQDDDAQGPQLRLPENPLWPSGRLTHLLRLLTRDLNAIDTVRIQSTTHPEWAYGLQGLGPAVDGEWLEWSATLGGLRTLAPEDGSPLNFIITAEDSLGNVTLLPWELPQDEGFLWSRASGRADQSWQPSQPLLPGSALAVRVPLGTARSANDLLSAFVGGCRLQARGPGELLLRLVQDVGGKPGQDASGWLDLADPMTLLWNEACPGWQETAFALPPNAPADSLIALQGDQVWLMLDYSLPSHLDQVPAPLLEWFEPGPVLPDSLRDSWSYNPVEEEWTPLPTGRLLLQARLETTACHYTTPYMMDFEAGPDLPECWVEVHHETSLGWTSSASGPPNSSCFAPADARFNQSGEMVGQFYYVNSDAQGAGRVQNDTLATPWVHYDDGAVLTFASCTGHSFGDSTQVLIREWVDGPGSWRVLLADSQIIVNSSDSLCALGEIGVAHPAWAAFSAELAPAGQAGRLQLSFRYIGANSTGWAIDNLSILAAEGGSTESFDGPPFKAAELGRIHPNPFNPSTTIPYRLLESGPVRLAVYNVLGQRVVTLLDLPWQHAGEYSSVFSPGDIASGVYFVRLEAGGQMDHRRLVFLK